MAPDHKWGNDGEGGFVLKSTCILALRVNSSLACFTKASKDSM